MSNFLGNPSFLYALGLLCVAVGGWLTMITGSMIPLSFGGAFLVMATGSLVRGIRAHHIKRRQDKL